jgi:hypothetical protein
VAEWLRNPDLTIEILRRINLKRFSFLPFPKGSYVSSAGKPAGNQRAGPAGKKKKEPAVQHGNHTYHLNLSLLYII